MAGAIKNLRLKNGAYYARLVVPAHLRAIIGKTELLKAIGPGRREAVKALPLALARMHEQLAQAQRELDASKRPSRRPLSEAEIAQFHYAEELALDESDRNAEVEWLRPFASDLPNFGGPALPAWPELERVRFPSSSAIINAESRTAYLHRLKLVAGGFAPDEVIVATIGWAIDKFADRGNVSFKSGTPEWRQLARTLAKVQIEAARRAMERDEGEPPGTPALPILNEPTRTASAAEPVQLDDLFEAYLAELARSGKGAAARSRWTPVIASLKAFMKHGDAALITKRDIARWKDELLESRAPKTVKDVYVASVKAVLQFAVDNEQLPSNPATGIKVRTPPKAVSREKGLTQTEACALLKAARDYTARPSSNPRTRESGQVSAAKRWVPWLCAYSGARVAEIGQLRKEDISEQNKIVFLRITPEAGSVKTGQFRDVPLHPHLLEQGFLEFIRAAPAGPLFYDGASKRTSSLLPAQQLSKRLSQWIRSLNCIAAEVDPNHGWRHRFKTVAREIGLDPRVVDAIQGHAARTAGENYGDVTLKAKLTALEQMPRYDLDAPPQKIDPKAK